LASVALCLAIRHPATALFYAMVERWFLKVSIDVGGLQPTRGEPASRSRLSKRGADARDCIRAT
jgi:hypothetical protein